MRVKVINTNRDTLIGVDDKGNRVTGTGGDEFSVPADLSEKSAKKAIRFGYLVQIEDKPKPVKKETKEKAIRSRRSRATKGN